LQSFKVRLGDARGYALFTPAFALYRQLLRRTRHIVECDECTRNCTDFIRALRIWRFDTALSVYMRRRACAPDEQSDSQEDSRSRGHNGREQRRQHEYETALSFLVSHILDNIEFLLFDDRGEPGPFFAEAIKSKLGVAHKD
jgi:hypothetical protein